MKKNLLTPITYTLYSIVMLFVIYCGASLLWIIITDYRLTQFCKVLSLVLKNAEGYSVLLVGVVITICFQIYTKEQEVIKENRIKIKEVGYYTLAFQRDEDPYTEVFRGDKQVVIISNDKDYFTETHNNKISFMVKFLSSKEKSTNLKNVMAFDDLYFQNNKKIF